MTNEQRRVAKETINELVKAGVLTKNNWEHFTLIEESLNKALGTKMELKPTQYKALLRRADISVNDFDFILKDNGSIAVSISNQYYGKGGKALETLRNQLKKSLKVLNLLGFESVESNQFYDEIIIFESTNIELYDKYIYNEGLIKEIIETNCL